MTKTARLIIVMTLVMVLATKLVEAVDEHDEKVKKDLFTVITLEGQSCGAVVSYTRRGETDYIAVCQSGDRYHITVVPEGRVSVKKL